MEEMSKEAGLNPRGSLVTGESAMSVHALLLLAVFAVLVTNKCPGIVLLYSAPAMPA